MAQKGISDVPRVRRPPWLRARMSKGEGFQEVSAIVKEMALRTVCREAGCPNIYDCFEARTATFLILGDKCTRSCRFCRVEAGAPDGEVDVGEARIVADAARRLGLRHVVITSVTRDDLSDGGATVFAETIKAVRAALPDSSVEVLVPDFSGDDRALGAVVAARPDVLNHNIESVPRLYPLIRSASDYRRSLRLLSQAKQIAPGLITKSGMMVGLGERCDEIMRAGEDLRDAGCDILTVGQYLQPSRRHLPAARYWSPEEFASLGADLRGLGFRVVEAGPLVRSSYRAEASYRSCLATPG